MNGSANIYYWKSKAQEEVDFVIKQGLKVTQLIQVCYDIDDIKTREREIKALIKAGKEFNCTNLIIITANYEAEEHVTWFGNNGKIQFIPLTKWLLKITPALS